MDSHLTKSLHSATAMPFMVPLRFAARSSHHQEFDRSGCEMFDAGESNGAVEVCRSRIGEKCCTAIWPVPEQEVLEC